MDVNTKATNNNSQDQPDEEIVEIDLKDFNQDKETIWMIRENPGKGDTGIHVLSINRQIVSGLIRECQVSSGVNLLRDQSSKQQSKQQVESKVKAIETTTCHVCPKCNTEAELRWKVEVQESQQAVNPFDVMIQHLQKQERKQNKKMHQEIEKLRAENRVLEDANKAAKEAFQSLDHFAKKRTAENTEMREAHAKSKKELEAANSKWKKRWENQKEENKKLKNAMEQLRAKYRTLSRQLREICPTPSFKL